MKNTIQRVSFLTLFFTLSACDPRALCRMYYEKKPDLEEACLVGALEVTPPIEREVAKRNMNVRVGKTECEFECVARAMKKEWSIGQERVCIWACVGILDRTFTAAYDRQ